LIHNLVDALKDCPKVIQQRMLSYFAQADAEYGRRVAEGIASAVAGMAVGGNGVANSDEMSEKATARCN
jgi:catalase